LANPLNVSFLIEGEKNYPDDGVYERDEFGRIAFDDGRQVLGIELCKDGQDFGDGLVAGFGFGEDSSYGWISRRKNYVRICGNSRDKAGQV